MFFKKVQFPLSHDDKSKNQPIVLKFVRNVAFLYLQTEFVAQRNRSITTKYMSG